MSFQFRWVFWVLGALIVLTLRKKKTPGQLQAIKVSSKSLHVGSAIIFFLVAFIAKLLQLWGNELNGLDFWLFVDLLEQSSHGGFFLTRFAPQSIGWVQHGSVHAFIPLTLFLPLVPIIGAKWTALLINPLGLALGGYFLGRITEPKWGRLGSLTWMLAFYSLSSNGKTLMYETHPESLYPALLFGVFLARDGWKAAAATLLCFSLKLDVLGLVVPLFLLVSNKRIFLIFSALGIVLQLIILKFSFLGKLGPAMWFGESVTLARIGGTGEMVTLFAALQKFKILASFLVGRPLMTLLLPVVWILKSPIWWVGALGLGYIYSWIPGGLPLWNYYSAPWVALAFLIASQIYPTEDEGIRRRWLLWMVITSTFLGGASPRWVLQSQVSSVYRDARRNEVVNALDCLSAHVIRPKNEIRGPVGLVSPSLIAAAWDDRKINIYSEFPPQGDLLNRKLDFVLLELGVDRYGLSSADTQLLVDRLSRDPKWKYLNEECGLTHRLQGWAAVEK